MSVSSEDIAGLAKKLLSEEAEISHRTSASRYYYAAFHEARIAADVLGLPVPQQGKSGSHEMVISRYSQCKGRLKEIGRSLLLCKLFRAKADYEISEEFYHASADKHAKQCVQVISDLKRFQANAQEKKDA